MPGNERVIWGFYPGTHEVAGDFSDNVFRDQQIIGVGWPRTGNLQAIATDCRPKSEFISCVREAYQNDEKVASWNEDKHERWLRRSASILCRFLCDAKPNDIIVYANKCDEQVYIGRIRDTQEGRYRYDSSERNLFHYHFRHFRAVEWVSSVPYAECAKAELSQARTQNTFWRMKACPIRFLTSIESLG